ncbi:Spo0B domain-containing protein [Vallitaleaceae bacterium 9-2]
MMRKRNLIQQMNRFILLRQMIYLILFLGIISGLVYYILVQYHIIKSQKTIEPIVIISAIFVLALINGFLLLRDGSLYRRFIFNTESREHAFTHVEKLNQDLRAQRHDFLNHIQVLYSLMELEEYEETRTYLNHLYGDIIKVGSRIKTESVSVNALLQAKSNEAEKKGIQFQILLKSQLSNIPIGEWELCRILGNLIDNAFDALDNSNKPNKTVTIQIYEAIKSIEIRVRNNGPFIPEHMRHKIFEAGFSSKGEKEERGMGLYIVNDLLENQGHSIVLEQEGDVCFHISLKK